MTITAYNFAKPACLSGDGQHRLTGWFQAAFALAGKAWAREFPFTLQADRCTLDNLRSADALARLPDGIVGYRVLMAGGRLPTLLILPRPLLLALVQGLLGEAGEPATEDRPLTSVEQSLVDYFLQTLWLPFFKDTWPAAVQTIWEWPEVEPNPGRSRLFPADEPVVELSWALRGPFGVHACSWLFLKQGIVDLIGSGEPDAVTIEPPGSPGARVETVVYDVPLEIVVVLGGVEVCIAQLTQLQVGDVVLLNQRVGEPLTALVGDAPKFRGWAGRSGSSTAFRIESVIER